jgi:hypothetical protein
MVTKLRFPQNHGIPLQYNILTITDLETDIQFISFLPTFSSLTKNKFPLLMSIEEATNEGILTLQIFIRVYIYIYTYIHTHIHTHTHTHTHIVCKKSISGRTEKTVCFHPKDQTVDGECLLSDS